MTGASDGSGSEDFGGRIVGDGIDTEIYGMPAFVTFTVADLGRSVRWYTDGLGFVVLAELPGPGGAPALVHLRRHRYQDILLVPTTPGQGQHRQGLGSGVRYTLSAGAEDLDARAGSARSARGGMVEGPARTPWNTVDLVCADPDGYQVVLTASVATDEVDQAFSQTVLDSVRV